MSGIRALWSRDWVYGVHRVGRVHRVITQCYLLCLLMLGSFVASSADNPWRAATHADMGGIWRQVGVVVLDPKADRNDRWFQSRQYFRFPEGEVRHVLVQSDKEPKGDSLTKMQRWMLEEATATQTLKWRSKGIAMLKHPERPLQRIDVGLYTRDAPTGPKNSPVKPKAGDLILVFYSYKDINVPVYFRVLRRQP